MDNTTLHTFLFQCPTVLRTLVLLGSWDNFSHPYHLELDARRGRNYWRGCFTFSDIICDGDLADLGPKRDGLLRMGGTYWYYYKVDGDEECHNPSEPSTTFCPLLPGQRLNVLELPREAHSRSQSESSDAFTRNPSDRYLNPVPPVPPKPISSPRSGAPSPNPSWNTMPLQPSWTPRSATYPPTNAFLSPNVVRHARSASASPHMPSTPLFQDFKNLKEKLASKRSASRTRSSSKPQEMEIGSPVLVSTTADDLNLVPLTSYRAAPKSAPTSAPRQAPAIVAPVSRSIPSIRKEFSPLGSHPVNPRDSVFTPAKPEIERNISLKRRRSHVPSTIVNSEVKLTQGRMRANSSDTRRTQHYLFSNDPWLSSPKFQKRMDLNVPENVPAVPKLQSLSGALAPPSGDQRPTSSHGGSPALRQAAIDKDLPALPRYLTPAPLFACNNATSDEALPMEPLQASESEDDEDHEALSDLIKEYEEKPQSYFSTWSCESMPYTCSTPDADAAHSPTFSSLTSNCSDMGSPQRLSLRYSLAEAKFDSKRQSTMTANTIDTEGEEEESSTEFLSASPPQLDDLRISTFGSDLFNLDIQHADSAPRRQAACFGLGFHYSLPEDDTTSKTTITESTLHVQPSVQRESSVSQLTRLMDDFGYLGDSVV